MMVRDLIPVYFQLQIRDMNVYPLTLNLAFVYNTVRHLIFKQAETRVQDE